VLSLPELTEVTTLPSKVGIPDCFGYQFLYVARSALRISTAPRDDLQKASRETGLFFIVTAETAQRIYEDPLYVLELTYRATQRRI
jgi:hypothetical protein